MREIYYYNRDWKKRPIVTNCLLEDKGRVVRGRAVCSADDVPCKKIGRAIAHQRATAALAREIWRQFVREESHRQAFKCEGLENPYVWSLMKCDPNPTLTQFERDLLNPKPQNGEAQCLG